MLTHVDDKGVKMVDISEKEDVERFCVAEGYIKLKPETIKLIKEQKIKKGNVLTTAQIAGILAVKKTYELIPMCHPIPITSVNIDFEVFEDKIKAICSVKTTYKTGIEMEALTGVSIALLTIWDMVKSAEKDENGQYKTAEIFGIRVVEKVKK
ncbi:cyclic pyranopterin monophosphate synthase MoaC [Methanocaldococcus fervens]|uniref:Probable cyclic pyranopterin monophosphate synthase n=1 Tax=Methanocaldococcus fervens (strain DSM 4213 / JCM 15782 / AG86) TaxID=573064 RepID=C7P8S6_METFA|nr:cyclic pyranopterin monophosphate synthase MoaC [Methanocaldococcus fervens]ACV24958.1 molybdenum cofactor biosynthesis protein C [Methanocaldococcus fervens AG86]